MEYKGDYRLDGGGTTWPVGGNDTYGIDGIPPMVGGRGVVQRAGLVASAKIVYLGSGRKDA